MFGDLLKSHRKLAKMTQEELGSILGVGKSTISEWESGKRSPDIGRLIDIANALSVSPSDLLGWYETGDYTWAIPLNDAYAAAPELTQRSACNVLEIPHVVPFGGSRHIDSEEVETTELRVYDFSSAAGPGNYIESEYELFEVPAGEAPRGTSCGIRISGHSMEPNIKDGDIVWVHETQEIFNHQIGIFILNEEKAVCKRAKFNDRGQLALLMSDNLAVEDIKTASLDQVRVFGRVLDVWEKGNLYIRR